jgi:hypothetical protein
MMSWQTVLDEAVKKKPTRLMMAQALGVMMKTLLKANWFDLFEDEWQEVRLRLMVQKQRSWLIEMLVGEIENIDRCTALH